MTDAERAEHLENLLATFLKPIKGIPFPVVIKAICGNAVEDINLDNAQDARLIDALKETAAIVAKLVARSPIRRPRPNEVGNDLEPFVRQAANEAGLRASAPRSSTGRGQQVGYPDILIHDAAGRATYLEVKSFADGGEATTMRSFYLSPSANPKVCMDARHIVLGFGVEAKPISGSRDSFYTAVSFKLINLFELQCDVKYEFNSDNRRMYASNLVLASGRLD
jgi:hypothetical protein